MSRTTWREQLKGAFKITNELWSDIESITLNDEQLDTSFDDGYGGSEGVAFTVWTHNTVYFPVVYDGSEWVGWVPRNPNGHATTHLGGE